VERTTVTSVTTSRPQEKASPDRALPELATLTVCQQFLIPDRVHWFGFRNQPPLSRQRATSISAGVKPPVCNRGDSGVAAGFGTMNDQPNIPIGMNVIGSVKPDERHLVASGIVSAFKAIWRDSCGPRLEYILYNAVSALLECRNQTLLGVNRLLTDDTYRAKVIRQITDPFIKAFWADEFENYDERFKREAIAPIQNKIGQFLLNPVVRNILGQVRKKVDIPFVMDNGRLFVANLSKGRLGHDKANLLGSLLVTQFQLGAMARSNRPEAERRDFYLFIDEFQNFSTDAFASILAEARKYRLCLTLSHQYIDQLPETIRQAVFGNVGTLIAFRIGYTDAEAMEKEFGKTIPATSLADLERYEAVVKLLVEGANQEPFRAKMLPPIENRVGRKAKLIALSRERFAMPRARIEAKLARWMNHNS
jgi:hypothetical protein